MRDTFSIATSVDGFRSPGWRGLALFFASISAACADTPAATRALATDGLTRSVEAHTRFLADDLLEGRGTGTRGYALAAKYVAAQFARIGLAPAGDDGTYGQVVRLLEMTDDLEAGRLQIQRAGGEEQLEPVAEVLVRAAAGSEESDVTAPASFVGYGVVAPELAYDDFGDTDLRGRIAIILSGAPPSFPADQRAHYSSATQKAAELVRRGAVGVITIVTPRDEARYPWAFYIAQSRFPRMRLLAADGSAVDGFPELKASATLSRAAASRLLVGAPSTVEEIFAAADRGETQPFDLEGEIALAARATLREVDSMNVLGLLPGSDASQADAPIVLTAHLDHVGIGPAVEGDTIYNGAMDNAIGTAVLLAVAEEMARQAPPRRPVLFAALTAEEKGLLGAEHLARNPPESVRRFSANLNLDMPIFNAPVRDVIAWGAEHSTLGDIVATAAARCGFTVSPDPLPDEVIFVRSDQYAFVKTGVPAVFLGTGWKSEDPEAKLEEVWRGFLRDRYHKPSDDLKQPIDWTSAGAFAALNLTIAQLIAAADEPPRWHDGDFFGERFGRDAR